MGPPASKDLNRELGPQIEGAERKTQVGMSKMTPQNKSVGLSTETLKAGGVEFGVADPPRKAMQPRRDPANQHFRRKHRWVRENWLVERLGEELGGSSRCG